MDLSNNYKKYISLLLSRLRRNFYKYQLLNFIRENYKFYARKLLFGILKKSRSLFFTIIILFGGFYVIAKFLPHEFSEAIKENTEKVKEIAAPKARANFQYAPNGGQLVVGSETSRSNGAATGNTASWRGTLSSDGYSWVVNSNGSSGLDQQVSMENVSLNGANKFIVQITAAAGANTLLRTYQICDWTSTTNVDDATDAQCTGGGWRTLNKITASARGTINTTASTAYVWHIYDGYWTTTATGNTTVSTPLTNFINSSSNNKVLIRAYSTSAVATTHTLNWVNLTAVIDPIYHPAAFTQVTGGTVSGNYLRTIATGNTLLGGNDNIMLAVPGTAGSRSEFYLSFNNVKTYTGANTILVRTDSNCSSSGISFQLRIYNFNSASWEALNPGGFACTTTADLYGNFAKNNVTISNYVSNGEVRVGWYGSGNSTISLRVDYAYIQVGTTNSDSSACEISFGTGTASDCANTRDADSTAGSWNEWGLSTEAEAASFGHTYYGADSDGDATGLEHAVSANLDFSITPSTNMLIAGYSYAIQMYGASSSITYQTQLKDYSGSNATLGGWVNIGTSINSFNDVYRDPLDGGSYLLSKPDDYINTVTNTVNMRIRTSSTGANNVVSPSIDFIMVSIRWVEESNGYKNYSNRFVPTSGQLVTGAEATIVGNAATGNTGSWKGTLATETGAGYSWTVTSNNPNGLNQQLRIDNVKLNGGNKMVINVNAGAGAATLARLYQVCDWVSSSSVDNAADAQCTGGGWRTLNKTNGTARTAIAESTQRNFVWHIYDGYWTTSATGTTPVSTPLSNFIETTNKRVLIRAYSTSAVAVTHIWNHASVETGIDPVYFPAALTQISGGSVSGGLININNPQTMISGTGAATGSDNNYISVPGTAGSISDFYLTHKNVKTYTGANTILVYAEYSCTTTGITFKPKIYNFNSSSWEDLISTGITCSATDAVGQFAKNNVTIANYISSGEIRIGWYGSANSTVGLRLDNEYVVIGTTNSSTSNCEITFGTGTAADCINTRDVDSSSGSPSKWDITSEVESATFGHDFYPYDNDADATNGESAASANLSYSITPPAGSHVIGLGYAFRYRSNSTSLTIQSNFKDASGINFSNFGGFGQVNMSNATAAYGYGDLISNAMFFTAPYDFVNTTTNEINVRIRTATSTISTSVTPNIDFVMVTMRWAEDDSIPVLDQRVYRFFNNADSTDVGSTLAAVSTAATLPATESPFRLRMLVRVDNADVSSSSKTFKLQYAQKGSGTCASPQFSYSDVTTTTAIAYYNNTTPSDGSNLTSNANDPTDGGRTIRNQTYEEANNFTNSTAAIAAGEDGKWDFALTDYSAPANTAYCFKIVLSTGTDLDTYTVYPQITTSPAQFLQSKYATTTGTSCAATFDTSVYNKSLIVVSISLYATSGSTTVSSVGDNKTNSYTKIFEKNPHDTGSLKNNLSMWYVGGAIGGSSFTITANLSNSAECLIAAHEYTGVEVSSPLDTSNSTFAENTGGVSGNIVLNYSDEVLVTAYHFVRDGLGMSTSFGQSFTGRVTQASTNTDIYTADKIVTGGGTHYSSISWDHSVKWSGGIAGFKVRGTASSSPPAGVLEALIVDSGGSTVGSPSVGMGTIVSSVDCQTATGTLGTNDQRLRVNNTTNSAPWTLSIAALSGETSLWTDGGNTYDYNDVTGSGCTDGGDADSRAGRLTIDPSTGTLTPQSGCTSTGITTGASTPFNQGTTSSITMLSAGSNALTKCYWEMQGINLSQTVPPINSGNYSLNLSITLVAV